jgi:hypothetical protein
VCAPPATILMIAAVVTVVVLSWLPCAHHTCIWVRRRALQLRILTKFTILGSTCTFFIQAVPGCSKSS